MMMVCTLYVMVNAFIISPTVLLYHTAYCWSLHLNYSTYLYKILSIIILQNLARPGSKYKKNSLILEKWALKVTNGH